MKFVAFFRNVNLGQGINPTRPQLEGAFAESGAADARSFQTAGTVVFSAPDEPTAEATVQAAREKLRERRGLREPAYVAPLDHLVELVAADPFAACDLTGVLECSATLAPRAALATLALPLASPLRDIEVIRLTPYLALSLRRRTAGMRPGRPTPFFEKLLGVGATTRGWGTIERLVKKYGNMGGPDALQE